MSSKGNSLVRHFTHRRNKGSDINRNGPISIRSKISGPVELVHTTNILSYNAPDISKSASPTSSTRSDDNSGILSNASSPPTSPDIASSEHKPTLELNHLSCYFALPSQSASAELSKPSPAPTVPQRAPSHTKKNSEAMSRKRSVSRFSSLSNHSISTQGSFSFSFFSSNSSAPSHRSDESTHSTKPSSPVLVTTITPPPPPLAFTPVSCEKKESLHNPFGPELEKVTEIVEEFDVRERLQVVQEDDRYMQEKSLITFQPEDYIAEIQELLDCRFADAPPTPLPMWI